MTLTQQPKMLKSMSSEADKSEDSHRMEDVVMSVLTTPGCIATKVKPSSGVTSEAQASVTAYE